MSIHVYIYICTIGSVLHRPEVKRFRGYGVGLLYTSFEQASTSHAPSGFGFRLWEGCVGILKRIYNRVFNP